ncbi:MAG: pyridine nucleotide-disulfide oxidoreductase, partial [Ignavibacteriae bacterium HGW-Ignavibacteriae-3]
MSKPEILKLSIPGFTFHDLFIPEKLSELTEKFFKEIKETNGDLFLRFDEYRSKKGAGFSEIEISNTLTELAPFVSEFVARLFGVEKELAVHKVRANREKIIFSFKKDFFVRRALKKVPEETLGLINLALLDRQVEAILKNSPGLPTDDKELALSAFVTDLVKHEIKTKSGFSGSVKTSLIPIADNIRSDDSCKTLIPPDNDETSMRKFLASLLQVFEQWIVAHFYNKTESMKDWVIYKLPHTLNYDNLVELKIINNPVPNTNVGKEENYRRRNGFDLTDTRYSRREVMGEVDYCIICHQRGKDSCSKGFHEDNGFKQNPLGYKLAGCPLDQKISESHELMSRGDIIGALAIIVIDNPMCPGTGHRICNDCMKACIYQKQDPVNIPQIETGVLTDVLNLPWGFEIYSLLTRWNPLNIDRPYALPYNGKKVLIVGQGPAGYTLSHYLLNEGFGVVGIDALKIEPLPLEFTGNGTAPPEPVRDVSV